MNLKKTNPVLCNWILVAGDEISSDCMDSEKCCCISEILKKKKMEKMFSRIFTQTVTFKKKLALLVKKTLSKMQRV